jgi:hypothetical protein
MKPASAAIALLFAICLAMLSACGGDNGDSELEQALRSVTENDLSIMVLPQDDLGEEFAGLEIDDDSGFKDNEEAADETIDPDDTAEDLELAGRINGYELIYSDPVLSALEAGTGVINIATEVDLFSDASAASDHLAKRVNDRQQLEGEEIEARLTLEKVEMFEVDGLADEAVGLRARLSFAEVQFYQTVVAFRLDRLVGAAYAYRADDSGIDSQIEAIARALEVRIEGVLLGDIGGVPVHVPQAEEEPTVAPLPEGEPDLAAMALSLDDLPAGVSIEHEGYVEDEDTVASYEREFDPGPVHIGASEALYLESQVELYENIVGASGRLTSFEVLATSESGEDLLEPAISEKVGFAATDVRLESLPTPGLGDDSVAFRVSFDSPLERLEMTFIFVRVDRAVGSVSLMGLAGETDSTHAVSLAEAVAAHMADEL